MPQKLPVMEFLRLILDVESIFMVSEQLKHVKFDKNNTFNNKNNKKKFP